MGEMHRLNRATDAGCSPDPADPREQRIACRRILHEMVRQELDEGSWGWFRRRALVRLARRLNLDEFEARLIIRAAEYEYAGGQVSPSSNAPRNIVSEYLQPANTLLVNMAMTFVVIAVLALGLSAVVWLTKLVS